MTQRNSHVHHEKPWAPDVDPINLSLQIFHYSLVYSASPEPFPASNSTIPYFIFMAQEVIYFFETAKQIRLFIDLITNFLFKICWHLRKKITTFANVIELERHIEILLLSNDCVIVPGFGGFMAHHVDARYDGRDNMFLPPLRTIGFNPQLTMNDLAGILYVRTISYPEAFASVATR